MNAAERAHESAVSGSDTWSPGRTTPPVIARLLYSLGYRTVGPYRSDRGWYRAKVETRDTREPRGERWVRWNATLERWQWRSDRPEKKPRAAVPKGIVERQAA